MLMDSAASLSGERRPLFETASVRQPDLTEKENSERNRQAWDDLISYRLVEWGRNPSALADEDFEPPAIEVINLACRLASEMMNVGWLPPTMVAPDGEGGVSFELIVGKFSQSLNISADGTVELLTFDDCRLITREPVPVG